MWQQIDDQDFLGDDPQSSAGACAAAGSFPAVEP